jgi:hypothetical protein
LRASTALDSNCPRAASATSMLRMRQAKSETATPTARITQAVG